MTDEKVDREKRKLEDWATRLVPDESNIRELCQDIPEYVNKLNNLIRSPQNTEQNISTIAEDVLCALANKDNPFKEFPWDISKNIFTVILDFGLKYTPFLIRLITELCKSDVGLQEKAVYKVAFLYSLLVSSACPQKNAAFSKLLTLMLKTSGCTGNSNFVSLNISFNFL